jgi:hypothetical protein
LDYNSLEYLWGLRLKLPQLLEVAAYPDTTLLYGKEGRKEVRRKKINSNFLNFPQTK